VLRQLIHLPRDIDPILVVVIHTEEEFDWSKGFDRNATSVAHMQHIHRAQTLFDEFAITPTYVVDYPIASQELSVCTLKALSDSGRALIGAHLHPWVSPPFEEEVCVHNSYPGNLPREMEYRKLSALSEQISASFGYRPTVYLAGRYGFGPNTAGILEELGFSVDVSPAPPIDFGADGGPDYSGYSSHPYWFGNDKALLGLPGTGAYVGSMRMAQHRFYSLATNRRLRWAHLPGILSRLGILERIRLSPEGYTQTELRRLTAALLRRGLRIFVFSFHSPSVDPGHTSYVRNEVQLDHFLDNCRSYFSYFRDELKGTSMTPLELKDYLRGLAVL
jgi:hypothetical protein